MSHDQQAASQEALLATVSRGGVVESVHHGTVVVVTGDDVWSIGDRSRAVWARSAVKPFQAVAGLSRGVGRDLEDAELAVMSASHDATALHVRAVTNMLARLGLAEAQLRCGPHPPYDAAASAAILRAGENPRPIHNNCSGKHVGMLALARQFGEDLERYLEPGSACQRAVRESIATFAGVPADSFDVAIDGCGAPTFRLPLLGLARGFARLLNRDGLEDVQVAACERLHRAISAEPTLYEGDGELCTELLRAIPAGRIWPKNGAEGLFVIGFRRADGRVVGAAVKIADGNARAYRPVVVSLLGALGAWDRVPENLIPLAHPPVLNTQGRTVGEIRAVVDWPAIWSN